jgi:tape measure domain-containing protein
MAPKVQVTISAKNFATKEFNKVTKSLSSVRNKSAKSNLALKSLDNQTLKVTKSMASLAKVGLASGLAGFAAILTTSVKAIKEASSLEKVSTQFEVLTGSVGNATKMLGSLRSFAASTPLSFDTISDGAKNLLAFGVGLDDVQGKLQQVGDLSMGNSDKMMTLVSAYGKIRAKGKASLEEINRFTENGVPLLDAMATNLNITTEELMKMITAGKIGLPEVENAMSSLTSEGGKFNGMLEKQSKTLSGQWSTFKDNVIQNLQTVGMTTLPTVKIALENVSTALSTLSTSKDFQSFIEKSVRFNSWLVVQLTNLPIYFKTVGNIFKIVADEISLEWNKLTNLFSNVPVINFIFETTGDTFKSIQKGLKDGDWSDLFKVAPDALKTGLLLAVGFTGIKLATLLLTNTIKTALFAKGFSGSKTTAMLAVASIGIGLIDAKQSGDYKAFGENIVLGLVAGLVAGGLTKSPNAGMLAFSIAVNFELGSKISNGLDNFKSDNFKNTDYVDRFNGSTGLYNPVDLQKQGKKAIDSGIFDKSKSNQENSEALLSGTEIGKYFLQGLGKGIEDAPEIAKLGGDALLKAFCEALDIHSPSKKATWIGNMFTTGLSNGIGDLGENGKTSGVSFLEGVLTGFGDGEMQNRITNEWNNMLGQLNTVKNSNSVIDSITGINPVSTTTNKPEASIKTPSFLSKIGIMFGKIGTSILPMITSFKSVNSLLNPLTTILSGVMNVLSPLIDKVLAPLNGVLSLIGQVVGKILAPVFKGLSVVTEYLGKGFIWLYNKAIVPVGNFLIKGANMLSNVFIGIVNAIISAINWIPGVNISKANYRSLDAGALSKISYSDLLTAGNSANGTTNSYSSSSAVQSYDINVYQTFEQPVIGDGGLAKVGEYFVKAVQEYIGSGGKVTFVKA